MLELLFGTRKRASNDDAGWTSFGRSIRLKTTAGPFVDENIALTYSAVWCASRILCETSACLPLLTFKHIDDGRAQAPEHRAYDLLKTAPNPDMGSMAWREGRTLHQVNWGGGFSEIQRDGKTRLEALNPIHPSRVRPVRSWDEDRKGRPLAAQGYKYLVRNNDNTEVALRGEEMLHVPGVLSEDGIWGKGVITYARESIGHGLAQEKNAGSYFGSGGMPRAVVFVPGLNSSDVRKEFRAEWKEMHSGPDASEIGILPVEGKLQQISISNRDSQFLESRSFSIREIARWYRIAAYLLQEYEKAATYASIEALGIEFIIYSLLPWLRRWEEQCNLKLFTREERAKYYVEHQLAGLLRGDMASRYAAYQTALQNGFMTLNEIRRLENLNSIGPLGDKHWMPKNFGFLGESAPAGPQDPAAKASGEGETDDAQDDDAQRDDENGDEEGANDEQRKAAARAVLVDVLSRMFTKEANAAARVIEAKQPPDPRLVDFYDRHRGLMAQALTPAALLLESLGKPIDASELADRLAAESLAILRRAYDAETKSQILARLDAWPTTRAEEVADAIMQ